MKRKKIFLFVTLLMFSLAFTACKNDDITPPVEKPGEVTEFLNIFASTTGVEGNKGTEANPYDIKTALYKLTYGDTLTLLPGTYKLSQTMTLSKSGKAEKPITIKNTSAENVILDFTAMSFDTTNRGIVITGNYYCINGIDVMGAGDNGMYIGGSFNIIEDCQFYNNRDTGLQLGRSNGSAVDIKDWPHNNLIKNCTSFNNYDDETFGENADGFAAKLTVGYGNVFDGCIAYRNSDDGWDLYAKTDSGNIGNVILYNCAAFENGILLDGSTTRDGDGNGFKLGGSIMKGDVVMKNCMSWGNMLHGVTDNSNPGVISLNNVTAYNNSVSIIEADKTLGENSAQSANFNVARSESSYNSYYGLLSYCTNQTNTNKTYSVFDEYQGAMGYSIMHTAKNKYQTVTDYLDASSYDKAKSGIAFGTMDDSVFESVECISGKNNTTVHDLYRNKDRSINLGQMLNVVDSALLAYCEGKQIGAKLNNTQWDQYEHYDLYEAKESKTDDENAVNAAASALTLTCNAKAIFQDFYMPSDVNGVAIKWISSDIKVLSVGEKKRVSNSFSEELLMSVYRDRNGNKEIKLTAEFSLGDAKVVKEFSLVIIKDQPALGNVTGYEKRYIIDQFADFTPPSIVVTNKSSMSGRQLELDGDYSLKINYQFSESKNGTFVKVDSLDSAKAGVYRVSVQIQSLISENDKKTISYDVYVVSTTASIDFDGECHVEVNKEGFEVYGKLSNVSGFAYILASQNATETYETVKELGAKIEITTDEMSEIIANENKSGYYVHVVIENKAASLHSDVYSKSINLIAVNTVEDFYNLTITDTNATTIYLLANDLDFKEFTWDTTATAAGKTFRGTLNGNGFTISNILIENVESGSYVNIFYKLKGSIMNVNFSNIKLSGAMDKTDNYTATKVAIIGTMLGGYIYNVKLTNIASIGLESIGGLVGQVSGGVNRITRVSLTNTKEYQIACTKRYAGGLVGNFQKDSSEAMHELYILDCLVRATIGNGEDSAGSIGGILGRNKNDSVISVVSIIRGVFDGKLLVKKDYAGGIAAGCETGNGRVSIFNCLSNAVIVFGGAVYEYIEGVSVDMITGTKNCSPIFGRYTVPSAGEYRFNDNYASFNDFWGTVGSITDNFAYKFTNKNFYTNSVFFDMTNVWELDTQNRIVLR